MSTLNSDASSYVGPRSGVSGPMYPLWMYHPHRDPKLVENDAQKGALGSGWSVTPQTKTPQSSVQMVGNKDSLAAVEDGITTLILDSIDPKMFTLIFPKAERDKQLLEVLVGSSSKSLAVIALETVQSVPKSLVEGTGLAWHYNLANTTWYRKY